MAVSDVELTIGTSSNALMSINVHLYAFQRIHRRPICPCHVIWTADISELKERDDSVHMSIAVSEKTAQHMLSVSTKLKIVGGDGMV